jgi:hypothetical protein
MMRTLGSLILAAGLAAGCAAVTIPDPPSRTASASAEATVAPSSEPAPAASGEPTAAPSAEPTPGSSDQPLAVLDVRCGTGAPVLASAHVRTSPRGVRFKVEGQKGWELGIDHALGHESVSLDSANQTILVNIAPGDVKLDCGHVAGTTELPTTPLRIEDPDGWYRTVVVADGAGTCASESIDYAGGARGKADSPLRQAQRLLRGLQAGDVVERGGYASDTGLVRVVRAGNVIGHMEFEKDGHGGWLLGGSTMCAGLSLG